VKYALAHAEFVRIGLRQVIDKPFIFVLARILLWCSNANRFTSAYRSARLLDLGNTFCNSFNSHVMSLLELNTATKYSN
jgi:hypothetical protein